MDPHRDTEQLVKMAQQGNDEAFFALIQDHKERLYRIALSYLRNEHDALEAVQETVCRALMKLKKLKEASLFSTWLIRILINYCIDEQKRQAKREANARHEAVSGLTAETQLYSTHIEDRLVLDTAVQQLEPKEKQVIILKYYEDMTIHDISQVLACPAGTVKTRLHRALGALRVILGKGRELRG